MDVSFEAAAVDPLMAIAPSRAPAAASDGAPSFDDHVAAHAAEPDRAPTSQQSDDAPAPDATPVQTVAAAPPQAPQMAPALTVQLAAAEQPASAAPAEAAPPAGAPIDISAPAPDASLAQPQAAAPQQPAAQTTPQHRAQPAAQTTQAEAQPANDAAAPVGDSAPAQTAQKSDAPATTADATTNTGAQQQAQPQANAASPDLAAQLATIAVAPVAMTATQPKDSAPTPQTKAIDGAKPAGEKTAPVGPQDLAAAPQPKPDAPQAPTPNAQARAEPVAAKAGEAAPAQQSVQQTSAPPQVQPVEQRHAIAEPAAAEAQRTAPIAHQVTREIVRKFNGGTTQFELRLDPPELGRVDVRLEVGRDNKVTAVIAADSPQAVTDLARGARDIAQALEQAGLELSENGLSFDLSQRQAQSEAAAEARSGAGSGRADEETAPAPIVAARPFGLESWRGVRVDLVA